MAADSMSPFVEADISMRMSIPPGDVDSASGFVHRALEQCVHKYRQEFGGVMLAYDNVRMEDDSGAIVDEMPNIHAVVLARAVLFRPQPGQEMTAVVTSVSAAHIGALVCGTFNATVAEDQLGEYAFDAEEASWNPKAGDGAPVRAGDAVTLRVVACKAGRGLVTVEASLVDCLGSDHPVARAAAEEPNFGAGIIQSVPAARGTKRPGKRSREAAAAAAAAAVAAAAAPGSSATAATADAPSASTSAASSSAASGALAAEGVDSSGKRPRLSADADVGATAAAAATDDAVGKPAKKSKKSKKSKGSAA